MSYFIRVNLKIKIQQLYSKLIILEFWYNKYKCKLCMKTSENISLIWSRIYNKNLINILLDQNFEQNPNCMNVYYFLLLFINCYSLISFISIVYMMQFLTIREMNAKLSWASVYIYWWETEYHCTVRMS